MNMTEQIGFVTSLVPLLIHTNTVRKLDHEYYVVRAYFEDLCISIMRHKTGEWEFSRKYCMDVIYSKDHEKWPRPGHSIITRYYIGAYLISAANLLDYVIDTYEGPPNGNGRGRPSRTKRSCSCEEP